METAKSSVMSEVDSKTPSNAYLEDFTDSEPIYEEIPERIATSGSNQAAEPLYAEPVKVASKIAATEASGMKTLFN